LLDRWHVDYIGGMSELLLAAPSVPVRLSLTLEDLDATKYPRARVYNSLDALIATLDLSHIADGRYAASYTVPPTPGKFVVHYAVYADPARTLIDPTHGADEDRIISDFSSSLSADVWNVARSSAGVAGSFGEAVKLLLGSIGKANYRIDNMVYNPTTSFMLSCRIRVFPDSATASASTPGGVAEGEIYTMNMSGIPDGTFVTQPSTVLGLF
jgi:hypothetical protein